MDSKLALSIVSVFLSVAVMLGPIVGSIIWGIRRLIRPRAPDAPQNEMSARHDLVSQQLKLEETTMPDRRWFSRNFLPVDVTKPETYETHKKAFKADIFTLLYFLSEIFKFKDDAEKFLKFCFSKMKKDALLLVLDFKNAELQNWIDGLAEKAGLECVDETEQKVVISPQEEKAVLKTYIDKFGSPKLTGDIMSPCSSNVCPS